MGWQIKGRGGRLRAGARTVAVLGKWEATTGEGGHFNLAVAEAERDPIGWDAYDPARLVVELNLRTTDWRGRARITSGDPLVVDIWRDYDQP